ncbi:enoyl-CoA hydratase/isomerase family protein [Trinickia mobilis]|uniref:enoyl-CoA hydratase/isomerase family protein n=1 Tax=Trinickia mobilis TaxID=2816356 RepID=UPI001A8E5EAE|nr:enoyl-CoA hydratase/isomerase family protein [Trinickia mobilis]
MPAEPPVRRASGATPPHAAQPAEAASQGRVRCHVVNRVAILTLERPHALNALSHDMVRELAGHVERCRTDDKIAALVLRGMGEKGFCAGGDVRALYQSSGTAGSSSPADATPAWQQFFIDEYRLDFALHAFPKPIVALMDGITMGGGMGLAQAATLRVATERSKIAMPETRIGFVPDVGATRFLSVMPVELELYVGLTGATLTGADAVRCRLADACVPSDWLRTFEERLQRMPDGDLEQRLADVFIPPANVTPHAGIDAFMPLVVKHFAARLSVAEIAASLAADLRLDPPRELRTWLRATLDALTAHSPTMLHVTREALLRGRSMTLAECFRMELAIAARAIEEGDFREGVRAHLVDKDRQPRWQPATLAEVSVERERHFLRSPWMSDKHPLAELGALPHERASKLGANLGA